MQSLDIFGLEGDFFHIIILKVLKKSISSPIGLILMIVNLKMISKQVLNLANLLRAQVFYFHKRAQVVIVYKNKDLIPIIF